MEIAMWILGTIFVILVAMKLGEYLDSRYPDPVKSCGVYRNEGCAHVDGQLCDYDKCKDRIEYELMVLEDQLDIPFALRYHKLSRKGFMLVGGKELLYKLVEEVNAGYNNHIYQYPEKYNPFNLRIVLDVVNDEKDSSKLHVTLSLLFNDSVLFNHSKMCGANERKVGEDRLCMLAVRTFFGTGLIAKHIHPDIFTQVENSLYKNEKEKPV